ncbi:FAD/NAD(P)-binding oxidoreductase [Trebonia kvetii]|uniref:FAD/NAD(P)-binding oxidoreductase n=1 Tax=Trebonia kvetii TaxID=2480626 RepID=A0A6P2BU32_9ACTN|nr:NAD(P)/FAD-dependent oxidoreductase [Trebonia kvetii]TVZ02609.1 FAD/NAD(P)-binding oxidoreductase [Trebonia kvetii]
MSWDVAIIGGGVVGTAIARELAGYQVRCVLFEADGDVGNGTSKANTAILHTGFDATPGTLESRLVARGSALLREYAERAGIAIERTGALLVAWSQEQAASLDAIAAKSGENGYTRTRSVSASEVYQREPNLGPGAAGGLWIPDEWIIDPWSVPLAYATEAVRAGVDLRLGTRVTGVSAQPGDDGFELALDPGREPVRCRFAVNAAGLASDEVDRMFGGGGFTIRPRKGELIVYDKLARPLLSSIILPVPTKRTKGVVVAPTVFGNVLLGPTAEDVTDRADRSTSAAGLSALLADGRRILPGLEQEEVTATYAGLRAATEHSDYQLAAFGRYVRVAGIRSTGLTASLGIAEHVAGLLGEAGLPLKPRASVSQREGVQSPPRMPYLGEAGTRPYQHAARIAADPAYGEIACHCERVSRGEIRDALASDIPPGELDGLRRRTRAMNGRCQAFWCGASVSALFEAAAAGARDGR